MDDDVQQKPERVDKDVALAPGDLLTLHQTPAGQAQSPFLSTLGTLAIDDRSRRANLASFALAGLNIERVMDALQRAVPIPQHEIRMRGALRRQILRQGLPLAASREHIEDRVQNLADVHLAPAPTAFGWRYRRLDQRPLAVAQITRVAQTTAVGSTAVFRLPHSAPLSSDAGAWEGITTDSSDSTTLWIGSQNFGDRHMGWLIPLQPFPDVRPERVLRSATRDLHDDLIRISKRMAGTELTINVINSLTHSLHLSHTYVHSHFPFKSWTRWILH